jgi:hypothetical protein
MQGRGRKGAAALGALAVVPLATAEAADAYVIDDGGGPVPAKPKPVVPAAEPATPKPPAPRVPRPANPTIQVDVPPTSYADDRRQPLPEPKPVPRPAAPEVEPAAEQPPPTSYGDDRRQPTPAPKPQPRPANPTIDAEAPPASSYADDRRQPLPRPEPAEPTPAKPKPPTIGRQPDPPAPTTSYADDHRQPRPEPEAEPEVAPEPVAEEEDQDDGGFSFGVDVNLPGDHDFGIEVGVDPPDVDGDALADVLSNPREALAEGQDALAERSADGIETGAAATKDYLDEKPVCAKGTVYRYGGGGAEVCIDTSNGHTSWSGQVGVGTGASVKVHRPDALPTNVYCGGGVTASSPVLYGSYERRYDFTENRWYNEYEYGVSVPYKTNKYLPLDGASRRPSNGRHVAARGERLPSSGAAGRHRGVPSKVSTASAYGRPGAFAAYGTCGGPGPDLW